jgi:hypothetical protein
LASAWAVDSGLVLGLLVLNELPLVGVERSMTKPFSEWVG